MSMLLYSRMRILQHWYIFLLFMTPAISIKTPPEEDFYYAAVVEYCPLPGTNNDVNDSFMKNVKNYASLIAEAAPLADIVIFPEDGLVFFDKGYTIFIEVPYGNNATAPADDKEAHPALQILSQAARNSNVYVVVNVHEKYNSDSTVLHYNTNVIFGRNGSIIGRYRKTHLFGEPLNITSTPERVYFDSDFGVRFGTFTCFDILFGDPSLQLIKDDNVTDILYPTLWYSSLPFFVAVQTQASWAYATDTNLLAAGGNSVLNSNTGSGIYNGKKGPVIYLQSQRNGTYILHARIIKKGRKGTSMGGILPIAKEGPLERLKLWEIPSKMDSVLITPKSNSSDKLSEDKVIQLCQDKFCCSFHINATFTYRPAQSFTKQRIANPYMYRVAVFNGIQLYYKKNAGVQYCAVISCLNDSLESCGKPLNNVDTSLEEDSKPHESGWHIDSTVFHSVTITASPLEKDTFMFPALLEISQDPEVFGSLMDVGAFSFHNHKDTSVLTFSSEKLVTGALYNRVFSRDDANHVPSNSYVSFSTSVILIISCLFFYFYLH